MAQDRNRSLEDRQVAGLIVCDWNHQKLEFHVAQDLGLNRIDDLSALRQTFDWFHRVREHTDVTVVTIRAKGDTPEVDLIPEREIMDDLPSSNR